MKMISPLVMQGALLLVGCCVVPHTSMQFVNRTGDSVTLYGSPLPHSETLLDSHALWISHFPYYGDLTVSTGKGQVWHYKQINTDLPKEFESYTRCGKKVVILVDPDGNIWALPKDEHAQESYRSKQPKGFPLTPTTGE